MSSDAFLALWPQALAVFLILSVTVPGFIQAVRALPWVTQQVLDQVKPWVCNICMTFWSCILFALPLLPIFGFLPVLLAIGPAYTSALWLYKQVATPDSAPPLPSFGGSDEV
jgi:hypothetical protein